MDIDNDRVHERAHQAHMHVTALLMLHREDDGNLPNMDAVNYTKMIAEDVDLLRTTLFAATASLYYLSKQLDGGCEAYIEQRANEVNQSYAKGAEDDSTT